MNVRDLYLIGGLRAVLLEGFGMIYRRTLRQILPKRNSHVLIAGVTVPTEKATVRAFDRMVPWTTEGHRPWHEHDLIQSAQSVLKRGDDVVVIGGGTGVSSVRFSQMVGENGSIVVYEASSEQVAQCRHTIEENRTPAAITVINATVGHAIELYGDDEPSESIQPSDLPGCDVMILDCEGAERPILNDDSPLPDRLVVETHGVYGSPTDEIRTILAEKGFETRETGVENSNDDVRILTAHR